MNQRICRERLKEKAILYSDQKGLTMFKSFLLLALLPVACLLAAPHDFATMDLSLTPIISSYSSRRVFLISFAHGEVHKRNQNYLVHSAINKGIDTIISYRKEHIGKDFYEQHKSILDKGRGVGYWLWKPYFVLETLKLMSDDDILLYVDTSAFLQEPVTELLKILDDPNVNMILFEGSHKNRGYIKKATYEIMQVDYKHREDQQLQAGFLAIKNTKASRHFIEKWLEYCCDENALTDIVSSGDEFSDFIDHRHDQAILSLLARKYPETIVFFNRSQTNEIFFLHRRRDENIALKDVD